MAKTKSKGGRPSKYKEELNKQAYKLCLLGADDKRLAAFFEVTESTISKWKIDHPKFSEALKEGKDNSDSEIAKSLYHRARGYSHADVHISNYQGKITVTAITKHYPPDTTACIFWLKNRQRFMWSDRQDLEKDEDPIEDFHFEDVKPDNAKSP